MCSNHLTFEVHVHVHAQENDQLRLEVKRLEKMVSELVKQVKVRTPQDNHRNMMNKLEKDSNFTKQAS
jgi:regulator of replication initiation timing